MRSSFFTPQPPAGPPTAVENSSTSWRSPWHRQRRPWCRSQARRARTPEPVPPAGGGQGGEPSIGTISHPDTGSVGPVNTAVPKSRRERNVAHGHRGSTRPRPSDAPFARNPSARVSRSPVLARTEKSEAEAGDLVGGDDLVLRAATFCGRLGSLIPMDEPSSRLGCPAPIAGWGETRRLDHLAQQPPMNRRHLCRVAAPMLRRSSPSR